MAIGIILGFVFAFLCIAGFIVCASCFNHDNKVGGTIAVIFAIAMLLAFVTVPFSFHTVDAGEIAVVKHLGKAEDSKTAGTHYDLWMTNKYQKIDAKVQTIELAIAAYSSDAQQMNIQMTVQYQIMPDKAIDIVNHYGTLEILQDRIQSVSAEKTKSVVSAYKAMNIISERASMSPAVEEVIKSAVGDEYFVNITTVVLTNIDFSDSFELAVEEKMIAEQKQLKAEYENQTKIAQAQAEADAKLVTATANAEAAVIEAEAQAKANELLEKSLTEKILDEMYIEKWDGKLPDVVAGENASDIMISVPENE